MIYKSIGILSGQSITKLSTRKTMYDNNCIYVTDDKGNNYLLEVKDILSFPDCLNNLTFDIIKKIRRCYLKVRV